MSAQQRVERIGRALAQARKFMEPCLKEWAIAGFENHFGVRLPEAYRLFLLRVGNGGWGPPRDGLGKLGEALPDEMLAPERWFQEHLPWIRKPFPFVERTEVKDWRQARFGCLLLADDGCGMQWRLVVTGPESGNVWFDDPNVGTIAPASPHRDFLGWYEEWLERQTWYLPHEEIQEQSPVESVEDEEYRRMYDYEDVQGQPARKPVQGSEEIPF
jgi:hypothetical protein